MGPFCAPNRCQQQQTAMLSTQQLRKQPCSPAAVPQATKSALSLSFQKRLNQGKCLWLDPPWLSRAPRQAPARCSSKQ